MDGRYIYFSVQFVRLINIYETTIIQIRMWLSDILYYPKTIPL